MRRALIAAVPAAAALIAALATTGSAQAPGERTLALFEPHKAAIFGLVDNPPRSKRQGERATVSPGDIFTFDGSLLDESRTKRVGRTHGTCIATEGAKTFARAVFQCTATYALTDGNLSLAGSFRAAEEKAVIAVVGGTGAYEGARGSGTSTEGKTGDTDVFHLLP